MHDKALALPELTNQQGMWASDLQREKMAAQKHQVYLQKRKLAARWPAIKAPPLPSVCLQLLLLFTLHYLISFKAQAGIQLTLSLQKPFDSSCVMCSKVPLW